MEAYRGVGNGAARAGSKASQEFRGGGVHPASFHFVQQQQQQSGDVYAPILPHPVSSASHASTFNTHPSTSITLNVIIIRVFRIRTAIFPVPTTTTIRIFCPIPSTRIIFTATIPSTRHIIISPATAAALPPASAVRSFTHIFRRVRFFPRGIRLTAHDRHSRMKHHLSYAMHKERKDFGPHPPPPTAAAVWRRRRRAWS